MPIFTSHHDNQNDPIERSRQQLATANSERNRLVQALAEKRQKRDALAAAYGNDDKRTVVAQGAYQETLAALPPLPVIRARLAGVLKAPAGKIAGVLSAPARNVVGVCKAYSQKQAAA